MSCSAHTRDSGPLREFSRDEERDVESQDWSRFPVAGQLMVLGILSNPHIAQAQSRHACPPPPDGIPVAPPEVTAQEVENGTGTLMDFLLSTRDRLREQERKDSVSGQVFVCLIRQEGSPWHSGSTYIVTMTPDTRVFMHAKDMSLSGRKLKPSIYEAILQALGVDPADLANPATARAAFAAAEAGNGGAFDVPGVSGASGYASVLVSVRFGIPNIVIAGFELDATHLTDEEIDYGDPEVVAADVVDRASPKAFVIEAGRYCIEVMESGDLAARSKARFALSDPNGPWRLGWRLIRAVPGEPGFEASLDATRREAAQDADAERGVMLRSIVRWREGGRWRRWAPVRVHAGEDRSVRGGSAGGVEGRAHGLPQPPAAATIAIEPSRSLVLTPDVRAKLGHNEP